MPIKSTGFIRPTFYDITNSNVATGFAELLMGNGNGLGGGGGGTVQLVQGDVMEFGFATTTPYFNSAFTRPSGVTDGYLPPPIDREVDFLSPPYPFEPGTNYQYALRGFEFRFRARTLTGDIQYRMSIGTRDTDVLPSGYFPSQFVTYGFGGILTNVIDFQTFTVGGFGEFFGYEQAFADGNISGEFLRPQYWEKGYGDSILGAQNGVVGQLNDYSGPKIRFEVVGEGALELAGSSALGGETLGFNIIYEEPDPFKIKIGENTKVVLSSGDSSVESIDGGYSSAIQSVVGSGGGFVNPLIANQPSPGVFGFDSSPGGFISLTFEDYFDSDDNFNYLIPPDATNIKVHLQHLVYSVDSQFAFAYTFNSPVQSILKLGSAHVVQTAVINTVVEDVIESESFTPDFFNNEFTHLTITYPPIAPLDIDSDTGVTFNNFLINSPGYNGINLAVYFYATPAVDPGNGYIKFKITYDVVSEGLAGTKATLRAATGQSVYDPYLEVD